MGTGNASLSSPKLEFCDVIRGDSSSVNGQKRFFLARTAILVHFRVRFCENLNIRRQNQNGVTYKGMIDMPIF